MHCQMPNKPVLAAGATGTIGQEVDLIVLIVVPGRQDHRVSSGRPHPLRNPELRPVMRYAQPPKEALHKAGLKRSVVRAESRHGGRDKEMSRNPPAGGDDDQRTTEPTSGAAVRVAVSDVVRCQRWRRWPSSTEMAVTS